MSVEEVKELCDIAIEYCRSLPQSRHITKVLNMIDVDIMLNERIRSNRVAEIDLRLRTLILNCDDDEVIDRVSKWMLMINDIVVVSNAIIINRMKNDYIRKHIIEFSTFCCRVKDCIPKMKTMEYAYGTFRNWHIAWHSEYILPTIEQFTELIVELDRDIFRAAIDDYDQSNIKSKKEKIREIKAGIPKSKKVNIVEDIESKSEVIDRIELDSDDSSE